MIEAALDYARRGFRVLPVRPNTKKPFGEGWQKRATTDPDEIKQWWTEAEAVCGAKLNVGLAMGQGMVALDLDKKAGVDGFKSLVTLLPEGEKIPSSWSTLTPNGGLHRFLRVPVDLVIKNSNSGLAPGVDIKSDGGFVVAPGSAFEGNPPLIFCDAPFNLYANDADARGLCESLKESTERSGLPLRLVIVDTLALAIAGGDENTAKDMGVLTDNAKKIAHMTGAHVMVIHHSGKDVSKGERGSSSLRATTDTMIRLAVIEKQTLSGAAVKQGLMYVLKQKDGEEGPFAGYRLRRQSVGTTPDLKVVDSCVVEFLPATELAALEKPASRVQLDVMEAFEVAEDEVGPGEWVSLDKLYEAAKAAADAVGGKSRSKEAIRKAADRLADAKLLIKDGQNWRRPVKQ